MKKETIKSIEELALGTFLSDWNEKKYENVIDLLQNNNTEEILVWHCFENQDCEEIANLIEDLKNNIQKIVENEIKKE